MSIAAIETALAMRAQTAKVPGVVAMARIGGETYLRAFGVRSVAAPEPMSTDTIFWIASMTKLVTSIATLQLIEDGVLTLDTPVADLLPEFADLPILDGFGADGAPLLRTASDTPTLRHLLTHTAGLAYPFMDDDLARYAEQMGIGNEDAHRLPRRFEAGARWQYGLNTDWLGQAVAKAAGEGLDRLFERRILEPLGMADTGFAPGEARRAGMHARLPDGGLAPIPFAMPAPPYFMMGGAGLYSTAADYMKLLTGLGAVLRPASVAALFDNAVGKLECGVMPSSNPTLANAYEPMPGHPKRWSLGLLVNPGPGPDGRAAGSGAWAGLANCYYWVDPANDVAGILLTQILPFADSEVLGLCAAFERAAYA